MTQRERIERLEAQVDALCCALHLAMVSAQPTSKWLDAKMAAIDERFAPKNQA